ncbi:antitoxin [Streptomonospora algeriensis]|uniref:Antitoxin n=1 Tax=Streptomonospora algeriensis TaxID=995084 RepID=A0ABW3BAH6_9ACTN
MSGGSAFDKIKRAAAGNSEKVGQGVDKLKNFAKRKTGGKYDEKIDKAGDSATGYLTGEQDRKSDQDRDQGGQGGSGDTRG